MSAPRLSLHVREFHKPHQAQGIVSNTQLQMVPLRMPHRCQWKPGYTQVGSNPQSHEHGRDESMKKLQLHGVA